MTCIQVVSEAGLTGEEGCAVLMIAVYTPIPSDRSRLGLGERVEVVPTWGRKVLATHAGNHEQGGRWAVEH